MTRLPITLALLAALGAGTLVTPTTPAAAADTSYGCFKVIGVSSINIRARPYSNSDVIGIANRGDVLVKWKRWCALRGFWCPVQKGSIAGHADKRYLMKVDCPQ